MVGGRCLWYSASAARSIEERRGGGSIDIVHFCGLKDAGIPYLGRSWGPSFLVPVKHIPDYVCVVFALPPLYTASLQSHEGSAEKKCFCGDTFRERLQARPLVVEPLQ